MSIGLDEDHAALADAVRGFVARHAPSERVRAGFADWVAGELPDYWQGIVEQGLTSLHLPEEHGGADAGPVALAVVVEEAARGLLPGPLLPSLLTSSVLARHGGDHLRKRLLPGLAAGATGATALSVAGLSATAVGDGEYRVSGGGDPVLGAAGASLLLLGAGTQDGGEVWFVAEPGAGGEGAAGIEVTAGGPVDHTRSVGTVTLTDVVVRADQLVPVTSAQVRALAAVLFAAEAVGLARWCVQTGVAYAKVREQFGRPIGSFQSIKHKCARMFVDVETMSAAAWDGARALGESDDQLALAAAGAAAVCLRGATDLALATITLLGGIGYTWEHDTHLYWRRAMTLENLLGPAVGWERHLGELVLGPSVDAAARAFDIDLSDADPAFRERVAATLAEVAARPADGPARRARLVTEGLVVPHYPKPYGLAASPVEQLVIQQEYERSTVAQPRLIIGDWALPTILTYGTDEQKDFFVPATLRGEILWCQLFSEPGAGSDLAALSTRARKVDGGWRLDGQKVWTSMASEAHYGICLARTDPDAPKHKGISYFLVDMTAPGLQIRPLREANGGYLFNEVFFDDVFVPDDRLVGEVNQGWGLARTTLGNERVSISGMQHIPADLLELVRSAPLAATSGDVVRELGATFATAHALAALGMRTTLRSLSGLRPGAESSVSKVASGTLVTWIAERAMRWFGPAAAVADGPAGQRVQKYLSVPPQLIGGGTVEIQLNVIAERILGLPRG
ncbi:acyl-CoA dehydrogenase [Frankia sp. CNm7]|uniref:acyl-CoA dehydrogenase n=1 Tax=Frankia nepalensis TaxID=1836974 RepID=UPI00193476D8|nr:acyl-CoA dehydrogenase [Frankia nepalensis]MBL7524279.1 acyl-CoA dehydrogenase [Frankia nepalensis]